MNWLDVAKGIVGPLATVLLAWAVGNRIAARWAMRQKRRDEARASANEFYRLYGEFFAVWKLWNYSLKDPSRGGATDRHWELLNRASAAEAGVEALLVKLTSERILDQADRNALGRFRQGFQTLRQSIRDGQPLDWRSSEHIEYAAFKMLASRAGRLVSTVDQGKMPSVAQAQCALRGVTSNLWEGSWYMDESDSAPNQALHPTAAAR
jgi:hypothetical protein